MHKYFFLGKVLSSGHSTIGILKKMCMSCNQKTGVQYCLRKKKRILCFLKHVLEDSSYMLVSTLVQWLSNDVQKKEALLGNSTAQVK